MTVPERSDPPPPPSSGVLTGEWLTLRDQFVPAEALQRMLSDRLATRSGWLLRTHDGRVFALQEAVRVLSNTKQETDPYSLIGNVDTIGNMLRRGFVMSTDRIALGRMVYDVEYGFLAQRVVDPDASGINQRVR